MNLLLANRVEGMTFQVRPDSEGVFRVELGPGTHAVALGLMYESRPLGEFVMDEDDLSSDFRLDGAWVRVTVRYVGAKGDPTAALYQLMVHLTPRASQERPVTAQPGYDGNWHLVGVPPGQYEVWTSSGGFRSARERFPLLVRAGEAEIPMEITIGDP